MIDAELAYGEATALVPPVTIESVEYSHAIRLYPAPTNTTGETIGSWVVESSEHLSGTAYRIVLRRDWQYSSFVIPPQGPGQGATEVATQHWMGGNACNPPEWWRVYHRNNPMAQRGSLESTRLVPGDGARLVQGSKRIMGGVSAAVAYGHEPSEVNYTGGENQLGPVYVDVEVSPVAVDTDVSGGANSRYVEGGEVFFDPDAAFPYEVTGLFFVDGATVTEATRVIFDNEAGQQDETYLPPNFGAGLTGAKFWWDPSTYECRISQTSLASGTDAVLVWILRDVAQVVDLTAANQTIIDQTSGTLGGTSDSVALSTWEVDADFDYTVTLFGPGILWWRESTAPGSAFVSIQADAAGDITVRKRDATNGTAATEHSGGEGLSFPLDLRVQRDTNGLITVSRRQSAAVSWTVVEQITLTGPATRAGGMVAVSPIAGTNATRYLILAPTTAQTRAYYTTGAEGSQSIVRFVEEEVSATADFNLRTGTITEVRNMTTDSAMTAGSATQRDRYQIVDGRLRLNLESDGDRVRVTFAATAPPTGPGMPPVTSRQPNFATFADPLTDARLATTDTSENRGNWSDYIDVDFGVPVSISPGDTIEGVRGAGVIGTHGVTVTFNDQEAVSDTWTTLGAGNYRALPYAGIILFRKSWTDTLDIDTICFRVLARRYRSGFFAHTANEEREALQGLDNLWTPCFTGYGAGRGMHGTFQKVLGHTDILVRQDAGLNTLWPAGFTYGISWAGVSNFWIENPSPPDYLVTSIPYWTVLDYNDSKLRTAPRTASTITAPAPNFDSGLGTGRSDSNEYVPGEAIFQVNPFEFESGALKDYVGSEFFISIAPGPIPSQYAAFSIRAIPVAIPDIVTRLNDLGADIEQAIIRVKVSGLDYQEWTWEGEVDNQNNGYVIKHINGKLFEDTSDDPGTPNYNAETDEFVTSGVMSFSLIGIRRNSQLIVDVFGNEQALPNIDIIGGGVTVGGGGSVVTSDVWAMVDFTGGLKFLKAMLNSEVAYDGFYLVPNVGAPSLDAAPDSMANYLETISNEIQELTFTENFASEWKVYGRSRGRIAYWDSIETGEAFFRFSIGGVPGQLVLPNIRPAAMQPPDS